MIVWSELNILFVCLGDHRNAFHYKNRVEANTGKCDSMTHFVPYPRSSFRGSEPYGVSNLMDYEWGVTFTGKTLLPIVVTLSWLPFMIRERFTSSLKTCWRLPTLFVLNCNVNSHFL